MDWLLSTMLLWTWMCWLPLWDPAIIKFMYSYPEAVGSHGDCFLWLLYLQITTQRTQVTALLLCQHWLLLSGSHLRTVGLIWCFQCLLTFSIFVCPLLAICICEDWLCQSLCPVFQLYCCVQLYSMDDHPLWTHYLHSLSLIILLIISTNAQKFFILMYCNLFLILFL